jgi:hypothetical protein
MKKWLFVALLVVGATVLGATVLKEPIANAAQIVDANIIGPLDGQGNVKVHEQGTANVNVTNAGVSVQPAGEPIVTTLEEFDTYTVPAGRRLVIQYISGTIENPAGADPIVNWLHLSTQQPRQVSRDYFFVGEPFTTNPNIFTVSQQVTMYVGPGGSVTLGGGATPRVHLNGYLLDA